MSNIKKWNEFINENSSYKINIKSKTNPDFFITIGFDYMGRVNSIINKWDVSLPQWYGLMVSETEIKNFLVKKHPELYVEEMDLVPLTSNDRTSNEKYIVGNYVVFNYFKTNNNGDTRPYRYIAKILDNTKYNRLKVEVLKRVFGAKGQVNNDDYSDIKLGDMKEIHTGNIVSQTSNYEQFETDYNTELKNNPDVATDEDIKNALQYLLKGSIYDKANKLDDRIEQLFVIHAKWIERAKKLYDATSIAKKLYTYERDLNK